MKNPLPDKKKKTVKAWAVVWPVRAKLMENSGQKAIFPAKKDAEHFLAGFPLLQDALKVVPCTIIYEPIQ